MFLLDDDLAGRGEYAAQEETDEQAVFSAGMRETAEFVANGGEIYKTVAAD